MISWARGIFADHNHKTFVLSDFQVRGVILPASSQWARRDTLMSRDKICCETSFVSQFSRNYPRGGGKFERGKESPLLWGRDSFGGILGDNLGEGNCESKIVSRQGEIIFAPRHQDVSQGLLGFEQISDLFARFHGS